MTSMDGPMKKIFVDYFDVISHTKDEFTHNTVIVGAVVLVAVESKHYRAAYVRHNKEGIFVEILQEFVAV